MMAGHIFRWCGLAGIVLVLATALQAEDLLSREAIEQRLTQSSKYLASDELEGRGISTAGIDQAA
ncbi:MAG: hypothetical protein V4719_16335, partial [Planctomycetota bacterium]